MLLKSTVFIRRLKRDVLQQLPQKVRQQVFVELAGKNKAQVTELSKVYAGLSSRALKATGSAKQALTLERQSLMVKLFRLTGLAKVPGAVDVIDDLLLKYDKVIIFGHHKDVLVRLYCVLYTD